jgi:hypothetical protein
VLPCIHLLDDTPVIACHLLDVVQEGKVAEVEAVVVYGLKPWRRGGGGSSVAFFQLRELLVHVLDGFPQGPVFARGFLGHLGDQIKVVAEAIRRAAGVGRLHA